MVDQLREKMAEIVETGVGEQLGDARWVPLTQLDSGARVGLDGQAGWVTERPTTSELHRFSPDAAPHFAEIVEWSRDDFEERIGASARALGLDPEAVVFSFPAVALVRALLDRPSVHFVRLALLWLVPSEFREARAEIVAVATNRGMPKVVRDLAQRLTVPA